MEKILAGKITSRNLRSNPNFYQVRPDGKRQREIASRLSEVVFGQKRAVKSVSQALLRSEAGLSDPSRPEFSALFAGPMGTGKTEMGRAIATYYSHEKPDSRLLIVSCGDYPERGDVQKILGSPNSFIGYGDQTVITPEFLEQDKNVIVFDEIEKGHRSLLNALLGILDKGKLVVPARSGHHEVMPTELNFANSSIILTSNLGSGEMQSIKEGRQLGFRGATTNTNPDIQSAGLKATNEYFKFIPEFLNRLDAVVIFDDLTPPVLRRILDKFIHQYNGFQRMPNQLGMTQEAKEFLISQTNPKEGGRGLRRKFDELIITPAAEVKLTLADGQCFIADLDKNDQVTFWASLISSSASSISESVSGKQFREKSQGEQKRHQYHQG